MFGWIRVSSGVSLSDARDCSMSRGPVQPVRYGGFFLPRLLVVCGRRRVSHVKLSVVVEVVVVVVFAFGFEWESRRCDLGRLDGHIEAL